MWPFPVGEEGRRRFAGWSACHKTQLSLQRVKLAAKEEINHEYRGRRNVKEVAVPQGCEGGTDYEQVRFVFPTWLLISFFFLFDSRDDWLFLDEGMTRISIVASLSFFTRFYTGFHLNFAFFPVMAFPSGLLYHLRTLTTMRHWYHSLLLRQRVLWEH